MDKVFNLNILKLLYEYKKALLNLAKNAPQNKFLENSFARWYFNCKKIGVFPAENIVIKQDIYYANSHKHAGFNADKFIKDSDKLFENIFKKYTNITKANNRNDLDYGYSSYKNITARQFGNLQDSYKGEPKEFYKNVDKLVSIYEFIGMDNAHLSIPPIYNGVELFGSPLNTHNREYCSPFEIEKNFGSLGSFWDYKFHKNGIYLCNPPFDEIFINKMVDKLLKDILNTPHKILLIITIPVWDSASQKSMGIHDYGMKFEGFTKLIQSKFFTERRILNKTDFPYWNYYTEELSPASWTHLIILSNLNQIFYKKNFNIEMILKMWRNFI